MPAPRGLAAEAEGRRGHGGHLLGRGVRPTTAVEGNTLTADEVKAIVVNGSAGVSPSREYLEHEVRNVLALVRDIDSSLRDGVALPFDRARLEDLNAGVLAGIPDKPEVVPGRLREHGVAAGRYLAPHWTDVPELIERFTRWLRELRARARRRWPDQRSCTPCWRRSWHTSTSRGSIPSATATAVWPTRGSPDLSESGVVPLVATNLLSDHYNRTRSAYYLALDAAQPRRLRLRRIRGEGFRRRVARTDRSRPRRRAWRFTGRATSTGSSGQPSTPARDRQREPLWPCSRTAAP